MEDKRITESQLILPGLYLMNANGGEISTSSLIKGLTNIMHPTGQDAQILSGRRDTYFSQKVRNLKSHDSFESKGLAVYNDGRFRITSKGRKYIETNIDSITYLLNSDFGYEDIKTELEMLSSRRSKKIVPYDEIISEGKAYYRTSRSVQRSRKLRDAAMEYFSNGGIIKCDCCGFESRAYYGEVYGVQCIEIHHLRPIFHYAGSEVQNTIQEALKNLLPVCPNCHRVIHKKHIGPDGIYDFKLAIQAAQRQ